MLSFLINVCDILLKNNIQSLMFGGCLPAVGIAFVQSPARDPWRLILMIFFVYLMIFGKLGLKMY